MAEVNTKSTGGKSRHPRSTRVDLTAMVDLGFLLITFFIFTTTLSTSSVMNLNMPKDSTDSMKVAESGTLSLLANKETIWLKHGNNEQSLKQFGWNEMALLRQQLITIRRQIISANGNDDKLFVMIKPLSNVSFGQVINLYDEMTICDIKRYAMADAEPNEMNLALYR